ncbi:MAG: type II toxin-antitoxin system VapC family toxin [Planctomycetia bacterium]|jgi:predicted nucleic acid-binding protein
MNLVDSCGWFEYMTDGPGADFFTQAIHQIDQLVVPVICLYEVYKATARECGEEAAIEAIAMMRQGIVKEINESTALHAAQLGLQHRLPMADSLILAIAHENNATLWTQDSHFKDLSGIQFREA